MRRFWIIIAPALLALLSLAAFAEDHILPPAFAGWQRQQPQLTKDPAAADANHSDLLREYGFTDFETATYTRDDRKIAVKAVRFKDASGAYGAFAFYKEPEMLTIDVGDQASSANERVIFYRANVLVQATLDRVTAMTGGELRELASLLPQVRGPARNTPTLPAYLPKQSYIKNSAKYVIGPVGLNAVGTPVAPELIDFSKGAEVALGKYNTSQGVATVMLISYPTPAIAGERLRAIEAAAQQNTAPLPHDLAPPLSTKRAGPFDIIVAGQISSDEAKSLLASINYDADVTWNERAPNSRDDVVNFLLNEAKLVGIVLGAAVIFGLVFAAIRLAANRYAPGKFFNRPEDIEIIELKLRD